MQRRCFAFLLVPLLLIGLPRAAKAGGPEFPAGGTRSLGRGAAGFARADDPSVMVRNPALLADLWDDQAMLGAHLLLPDSCMQPTGAYGWGVSGNDVSNFGQGPVYLQANQQANIDPNHPPDTDLNGKPLKGYGNTPFPKVCYQGPAPFLPQVALSMKPTRDLGIGFGFFPPDTAALNQWGNRDGTIDTPDGKRPDPLRYYRSTLNVTYFSLLGAIGYRLAPWISIGAGFQWSLVAFYGRSWTEANTTRNPSNDVKTDVFGRDLFIPGAIASVQLRPADWIDVALGFKWSDRVRSNAKLDITSGAFGTGSTFTYLHDGMQQPPIPSTIPTRNPPVRGSVDSPPVWVPQLSLGIRIADRLKPKPQDDDKGHRLAGKAVEDHMLNERFDVELDGVYYFNSVYNQTSVIVPSDAVIQLVSATPNGGTTTSMAYVGKCQMLSANNLCTGARKVTYPFAGKNQVSARLGGDYNVLPGILAIRAGVSYENNGQNPEYLNLLQYMLGRVGVHGGFTLRVADKTDISFGFAHFIQKGVNLQVNDLSPQGYPPRYKTAEDHFQPGLGIADTNGNNANGKNGFDGVAKVELPNGDLSRITPGPQFINAGKFYYNLEVVSLNFTQHF